MSKKVHKFISGFVVGLIIGSVCGVFFSSSSGKEIRRKIVDKTKQSINKIKDKLKETKEE